MPWFWRKSECPVLTYPLVEMMLVIPPKLRDEPTPDPPILARPSVFLSLRRRVLQGSPWGIFQAPAPVAVNSRGRTYGCGIPVPTGEGFHTGFRPQGIPRGDVFRITENIDILIFLQYNDY